MKDLRLIKLVLFNSRERFRFFKRLPTVDRVGIQMGRWKVIPIVIARRPSVGELHFEAAAPRHSLVLDDPDFCHAPRLPNRTGCYAGNED